MRRANTGVLTTAIALSLIFATEPHAVTAGDGWYHFYQSNYQTDGNGNNLPPHFWQTSSWYDPNNIDDVDPRGIDNKATVQIGSVFLQLVMTGQCNGHAWTVDLNENGTLGSLEAQVNFIGNNTLTMHTSSGKASLLIGGSSYLGDNQQYRGLNLRMGGLALASDTEFIGDSGTTVNIWDTVVSGQGSLDVDIFDGGTLQLSKNNTYQGGTVIRSGLVSVGGSTGTTGTLGSGAVEVQSAGNLSLNRSNTYVFANSLSGTGNISQDGAGVLALTANNTFSGQATINNGTLQIGNGSSTGLLGTGSLQIASGGALHFNRNNSYAIENTITGTGQIAKSGLGAAALTKDSSFTGLTTINQGTIRLGNNTTTGSLGTGEVAVASGAVFEFRRSNDFEVANLISGAGNIVKNGAGTAILTGANTYTGSTTINSGVLQVGNYAGTGQLGTGDTLVGSTGTLRFARSNSFAVTGTISGTGTINKQGLGAAALIQDNTFSGLTTINQGTIRLGNNTTTGSLGTGEVAVAAGAVFEFRRSNDFQVANLISGEGNVVKNGAGTAILTGANTYTGSTTINSGVLQIGNYAGAGQLGTGDTLVGSSGTLRFARSNSFAITGTISGTGKIDKQGLGSVALTGDSSFSGLTTINQGTIRLGNTTATGSLGTGEVAVASGAVFEFRRTNDFEVANLISGAGNVVKNAVGTAILTGANTYTGSTTINSGVLQIGNGGTSGSLGSSVVDNYASLSFDRSDDIQFNNLIQGSGNVIQNGAGTAILTGANTYTGSTTINSGVLQIGNYTGAGQLGTGDTMVGSHGTLRFARSNSFTVSSTISGTGTIDKQGLGTVAFSQNNSFSGLTTINQGAIRLGNNTTTGSLGTGEVAVASGAVFEFRRSNDFQVDNLISGGGSVIKNGAGTAILTGANTYTGSTTINSGTLQVGNGGTSGSLGSGVIDNYASLSFNRSDTIQVNNLIQGSGSLVQRGTGAVTLTNQNTYSGSTEVLSGRLVVASGARIDSSANATSQANVQGGILEIASGGEVVLGSSGVATIDNNGQLIVNGSLQASSVQLQNGATLSGTGVVTAGDVWIASSGLLGPGNSIGQLDIIGNLSLAGTYDWEVQSGTNFADLTTVTGDLSLTGSTLNLIELGTWTPGAKYSLFAYSGDLFGSFSNDFSGTGWALNYFDSDSGLNGDGLHTFGAGYSFVTITASTAAVPEPASLGLLSLIAAGAIIRRRRSKDSGSVSTKAH